MSNIKILVSLAPLLTPMPLKLFMTKKLWKITKRCLLIST